MCVRNVDTIRCLLDLTSIYCFLEMAKDMNYENNWSDNVVHFRVGGLGVLEFVGRRHIDDVKGDYRGIHEAALLDRGRRTSFLKLSQTRVKNMKVKYFLRARTLFRSFVFCELATLLIIIILRVKRCEGTDSSTLNDAKFFRSLAEDARRRMRSVSGAGRL